MKYFLHDTSAFDDEKVSELYIRFGYEGVGLFYVTLEKIGKQEKPVKTEVLKKQLRIGKRLEKCWNFMESLGIISSNNGETFNKQLLNFSEKYQIKSEKNAKRIAEWREKQKDTKNVTHYEQVRNTPKVKESKVNRSKELNVPFNSDEFNSVWGILVEEPKWKNKTTNALQQSLNKLSAHSENIAIKMIKNAIAGNWQGLVEIEEKNITHGVEPESKAAKTLSQGERLTMEKVEQTRREEALQNS